MAGNWTDILQQCRSLAADRHRPVDCMCFGSGTARDCTRSGQEGSAETGVGILLADFVMGFCMAMYSATRVAAPASALEAIVHNRSIVTGSVAEVDQTWGCRRRR